MAGNIRIQRRLLLASTLIGACIAGSAPGIGPATAQTPNGSTIDVQEQARLLAERVAQARVDGFWTVQSGDHFYRIARAFIPEDRPRMERLRERLIADNPQSYMAGKPALLILGARIRLPRELIAVPPGGASATALNAPSATRQQTQVVSPPMQGSKSVPPTSTPARAAESPAPAAAGNLKITALDARESVPVPRRATPAYVDQFIVSSGPDNEVTSDAEISSSRLGRRSLSLGLAHATRDRTEGLSRDSAMELRLTTETENYGDFRLDTHWVQFNPATQDLLPARRGFNATLYNTQLPIGAGWTADSAAGIVRSLQPLWVTSSYRVVLPSSLLMGATTQWTSERADVRFAAGNAGRLAGVGILDFERTSGRLATASTSVRLAPSWQIGGALLSFADSKLIPDHTAATLAVEYNPGAQLRARAHLLGNSGGRSGAWTDIEYNPGRWRNRAGAYSLDPDLAYADSRPQNDIRGVYARSEYRTGFDIYVFGVESSQSNIENDPQRSGTASDGGYASALLRLDRTTTVGAGLSLRRDRPRQGSGEPRNVAILSSFWSRQFALGLTRLDGNFNRTETRGSATETVSTLQLAHDFPRWKQLSLSMQATTTRESLMDGPVNRRTLGANLRGPLVANVFWDANLALVDVTGEGQSERGYNASLAVDWPISAAWSANLSWQRNQLRPGADNPLNPFRKENTVLLNVRYDIASGIPYPRVVGPGGRQGTGVVSGTVFFDENGDGIRQASERGAEGILVLLDGRFPATTNRDGSFTFGSVTVGNHAVSVLLEKVPLPWGLADETPRPVNVRLREESKVEIGLTRISP